MPQLPHPASTGVGRDHGESRIQQGLELAPVPLDLRGKNRALSPWGATSSTPRGRATTATLVRRSPKGAINATYCLAGGTAFGPFVSRNITPDESGRPAGLTRDEFIQLMRTGHDPDNPTELLQVMPWPVYGKMVDRDLEAVYEYLRAIPHAETSPECGDSLSAHDPAGQP